MTCDLERLERDEPWGARAGRPDLKCIRLPGKNGQIFCTFFQAAGEGPRPTVLLTHGFPGNEQNLDLAQSLRRVGFHVMTFHYSGCWGSTGSYSFTHCLQDANTVLDYLCSAPELQVDPRSITVVGHSMGGFVAGQLLAHRAELRAGALAAPCDIGRLGLLSKTDPDVRQSLEAAMADGAPWLSGTDAGALCQDILQNAHAFALTGSAAALAKKPLLLVGGTLDTITPIAVNLQPLVQAVQAHQPRDMRFLTMETDHYFSDLRLTLAKTVAEFLAEYV